MFFILFMFCIDESYSTQYIYDVRRKQLCFYIKEIHFLTCAKKKYNTHSLTYKKRFYLH